MRITRQQQHTRRAKGPRSERGASLSLARLWRFFFYLVISLGALYVRTLYNLHVFIPNLRGSFTK